MSQDHHLLEREMEELKEQEWVMGWSQSTSIHSGVGGMLPGGAVHTLTELLHSSFHAWPPQGTIWNHLRRSYRLQQCHFSLFYIIYSSFSSSSCSPWFRPIVISWPMRQRKLLNWRRSWRYFWVDTWSDISPDYCRHVLCESVDYMHYMYLYLSHITYMCWWCSCRHSLRYSVSSWVTSWSRVCMVELNTFKQFNYPLIGELAMPERLEVNKMLC